MTVLAQARPALAVLAACGAPPAVRATRPSSVAGRPSIRQVDFADFTYDVPQQGRITVANGRAELAYDADGNVVAPGDPRARPAADIANGELRVAPPVYGDVDGDGADDAAVVTELRTGGTGAFTAIAVFHLMHGAPEVLGWIPGGDRGDGGIARVSISGGALDVDRLALGPDDSACCPSKLRHERWTWNGHALVEDAAARAVTDLRAGARIPTPFPADDP